MHSTIPEVEIECGHPGVGYLSSDGHVIRLAYLNRKNHFIAVGFRKLRVDKHLVRRFAKIGFPSTVQQSFVSVGPVFVTACVNYFGPPAMAAFGVAGRIDMVATMLAIAIGMPATAPTGHNLCAKNPECGKVRFERALLIGTILSGAVASIACTFPKLTLSMFIHHEPALAIGVKYLRIVAPTILFSHRCLAPQES